MKKKKKKDVWAFVGVWAFIIGMIVAIIAGVIGAWATPILVILGLIVGLLNVNAKEGQAFLFAVLVILIATYTAGTVLATSLATLGVVGEYLHELMGNINIFVFPAAIIVALKEIYALAKS